MAKSVKERVEAIVKENPGVLSRDIAIWLGIPSQSVNMAVHQLQVDGKIYRLNSMRERCAKWQAGPAPEYDPKNPALGIDYPKQRTVKSWEFVPVPRDALIWGLFGAQP
jgi:hypothetical protein